MGEQVANLIDGSLQVAVLAPKVDEARLFLLLLGHHQSIAEVVVFEHLEVQLVFYELVKLPPVAQRQGQVELLAFRRLSLVIVAGEDEDSLLWLA